MKVCRVAFHVTCNWCKDAGKVSLSCFAVLWKTLQNSLKCRALCHHKDGNASCFIINCRYHGLPIYEQFGALVDDRRTSGIKWLWNTADILWKLASVVCLLQFLVWQYQYLWLKHLLTFHVSCVMIWNKADETRWSCKLDCFACPGPSRPLTVTRKIPCFECPWPSRPLTLAPTFV